MGHMLHARARMTPEVRREIQNSQESLTTLAQRYGVNIKTIAKWRKRDFVHDVPMGPKLICSKSLSEGLKKLLLWLLESIHSFLLMIVCMHCRRKFLI